MAIAKEQLRQIIRENDLKSAGDVYALLKDSFKDLLQELLEAELDVSLGYDKNEKHGIETDNKRNGHTPKTVKSEFGEFQLDIPRDRNGEFEPEIVPKYCRDISGIEEKVISLYGGKKYPYAISNWDVISPFFQFSDDIRRIMYTTNIIEGVNRQFRKVKKTKSVFPNDTALEKMLYLASVNVMKKWKMHYRNWDLVLSQLSLLYDDRLRPYL